MITVTNIVVKNEGKLEKKRDLEATLENVRGPICLLLEQWGFHSKNYVLKIILIEMSGLLTSISKSPSRRFPLGRFLAKTVLRS